MTLKFGFQLKNREINDECIQPEDENMVNEISPVIN
jgi:hypothetical protein